MRGRRPCAKRGLSIWSARGFAELDQRLVEAREERKLIAALTEHVGGRPTAVQTVMIKRIARLTLLTAQLEARTLGRNELGDLEQRQLCALSNSLRLYMCAIGLERQSHQTATLHSYLVDVGGKAA